MPISLTAHDAAVRYGDFEALSLTELHATGQIIAVIGHNGSGKSTLLKSLLRLITPHRGALVLASSSGQELRPELDMAFCPEGGAVFSDIPVKDYLRLWGRLRLQDADAYLKQSALLEELGVTELLRQRGDSLSKGQRRRVQIAASYLTAPHVVLLDEPFDGLDVQRTEDLQRFIHSASGVSRCVLTSHRMDVVERVADAVVVLERGRCVVSGSVLEVCRTLAPDGFAVGMNGDTRDGLLRMERAFPKAIVYAKGRMLYLAGHIEESALRRFVEQAAPGADIERIPASLTDAMSYHLKSA